MYTIELQDKAKKYPLPADPNVLGHGYELRRSPPTAGVQHTTNNSIRNTSFDGEIKFLLDTPNASAHYLIGKDGRIVQFLDPRKYAAWHAGEALAAYVNQRSIGIEWHVSVGEVPTKAQRDAGAWLWGTLMAEFGFPTERIETHRYVALPAGRKSDPEGMSNDEFYRWRATFVSVVPDPWAGWGTKFPLDPAQRPWKIPQTWLRSMWLGEARSFEMYDPAGLRSIQFFREGWIVYEKNVDWAMAYRAGKAVP